jgi:hypothetical protein
MACLLPRPVPRLAVVRSWPTASPCASASELAVAAFLLRGCEPAIHCSLSLLSTQITGGPPWPSVAAFRRARRFTEPEAAGDLVPSTRRILRAGKQPPPSPGTIPKLQLFPVAPKRSCSSCLSAAPSPSARAHVASCPSFIARGGRMPKAAELNAIRRRCRCRSGRVLRRSPSEASPLQVSGRASSAMLDLAPPPMRTYSAPPSRRRISPVPHHSAPSLAPPPPFPSPMPHRSAAAPRAAQCAAAPPRPYWSRAAPPPPKLLSTPADAHGPAAGGCGPT